MPNGAAGFLLWLLVIIVALVLIFKVLIPLLQGA